MAKRILFTFALSDGFWLEFNDGSRSWVYYTQVDRYLPIGSNATRRAHGYPGQWITV